MFAILSSLIRVSTIFPISLVWSGPTLFPILSSVISGYIIGYSQSGFFSICHSQQSDQGLHNFPFFLSSMITVYTVRHSQQSDQGLHYLPFSAISSRSKSTLLFSGTVWSGSTLFAILSSLSWSTLFAIISSLIKIKVHIVILRNSLITVCTIFQSQ